MNDEGFIVATPWDKRVFGIETYEIRQVSDESLSRALAFPGHFTVKVDPLFPKKVLHDYGFYYCDTLIEPHCFADGFIDHKHDRISISRTAQTDKVSALARDAFVYGRFHRDFNIERTLAEQRYLDWLHELCESGQCLSLLYDESLAGFFAYDEDRILLHALDGRYRGKGLARYFWSAACRELFSAGHRELSSSISAANVAVLNVYSALGFRFRKPCDVYHRMNRRSLQS